MANEEREQKQIQRPATPTETEKEDGVILEDLENRLKPRGITIKTWGRP